MKDNLLYTAMISFNSEIFLAPYTTNKCSIHMIDLERLFVKYEV